MPVDHHVQRMIEELKEALARTIRSSSAVSEAARKIRREGVNLHLVLSFENDGPSERTAPTPSAATEPAAPEPPQIRRLHPAKRAVRPGRDSPGRDSPGRAPAFRLNGNDVPLLESLGIDPTRRVRSSSKKRRRPPLSGAP